MNKPMESSRLSGYDMNPPSFDYALKTLTRLMGEAEAKVAWQKACAECGIAADNNDLNELEKVFNQIAAQQGTLGVVGKSLVVRTRTYKMLSKKNEN